MNKQNMIERLSETAGRYHLVLDADILEKIVSVSVFRILKKDTLIRRIGDRTDNAAFVIDGLVRCYYIDDEGNDITRGFSVRDGLCMEDGLFGYTESMTECETLTDTTLMIFKVDEIKRLIHENDALKNAYIYILENGLKYKIYRENGFLVESASERYLHFRKLFPEIARDVKQQYIATYLGIAPESLSRIKKNLKETESEVVEL